MHQRVKTGTETAEERIENEEQLGIRHLDRQLEALPVRREAVYW